MAHFFLRNSRPDFSASSGGHAGRTTSGAIGSPVSRVENSRSVLLNAWFGFWLMSGCPALVAAAMSIDVSTMVATGMPRIDSTRSAPEPDVVVGPVEQQVAVVAGDVEHLEGLERDLDVLQGRDVERGDDDALVGLVEGGQRLLVEGGRGVDDDVVERLAQRLEDPRDQHRA